MLHLALAFAVELVAIASLGMWGYAETTGTWKWIFGIGAPVILIALWGVYAAPTSNFRLDGLPLLIFKIVVFALATVAFSKTHQPSLSAGIGIASIISLALSAIWRY